MANSRLFSVSSCVCGISFQVKNTFLDYETDCTPLGQRLTVRCKRDLFIGAPLVNLRHVRVCELEAMVYLVR